MAKKYFINLKTGKLHRAGSSCPHVRSKPYSIRYFNNTNEVYESEYRYFQPCRICFKNGME